ncbi:hypothetical protein J1N35_029273 [Gossypium stocksii]|uniref:Uncharacterized protein n=1 Tax=Gossypium stocksii TaxID=47602 RepID=A0A9D3UXM6_9ROSI|nr:hypothetical protein J1N35_029273 [Gossypium stocksii]
MKLYHKVELDGLYQSYEEAIKKYQEGTIKNLTKAQLELRSNLVVHAQVIASPLNLS